jgi:transposase
LLGSAPDYTFNSGGTCRAKEVGPLYLSQPKKKAQEEGAVIAYVDEASFRQTPTLHQTWAPLNSQPQIPTRGQRNTQKILGAVSLYQGQFVYRHQTEYFNTQTYRAFLEEMVLPAYYRRRHRVFLIQDNASYHSKPEILEWFARQRKKLQVFDLPRYSPNYNAQERIWHYTRKEATHNRYFEEVEDLCASLFTTFADIQRNPEKIGGLLRPFF